LATAEARATQDALLNQQATATAAAAATLAAMSADERATEAARATTAALAVEATLAAYATEQAASNENLDELAREAAQAAMAAEIAAIATENAASGANALATTQAELAALQAQQANAQVTATALAVVAANSVLDPERQAITIQTDLDGMLGGDQEALDATRQTLDTQLSIYPLGCRAGFVLVSGNAPTIEQGIELARQAETLLREARSDVFTDTTGFEHFALPGVQPSGEVAITIFFYSGCTPIS
jgi:hypothetical protein